MNQHQKTIEQLFRRHYARLRQIARVMLHDEEDSRDAVSDVFARLAESDRLPDAGMAAAYLATSVRNRCRDIIAHQQVRQRVERLIPLDDTVYISEAAEQQRYAELRRVVDTQLSPMARQVFLLRFERRLKYQEIAAELGVSEKTVYKHLHQAIIHLHEHFKAKEL